MVLPTVFLIHTCTIQRRYMKQKFTYTGGTGTPTVGQTLTGGTSHKTAVIDQIFSGYLVMKNLSGTFTIGETVTTTTFSGTLSAMADVKDSTNDPTVNYYWMDDQTSVPCRFFVSRSSSQKSTSRKTDSGLHVFSYLRVMFGNSVTVSETTYQIVSTVTGFTGTFKI